MISRFARTLLFAVLLTGTAVAVYAQPDASERTPSDRSNRSIRQAMDLNSMLAKQRAERDKRDHKEMLARGEEALKLANQLEVSFAETKNVTPEDKARLQSLENIVEKIRKELGGDDDGDVEDPASLKLAEEPKPSTVEEAFKYLHSTTIKLVDELKKTTRFTISAVAIRSSNSVLRIVKFLRLRK